MHALQRPKRRLRYRRQADAAPLHRAWREAPTDYSATPTAAVRRAVRPGLPMETSEQQVVPAHRPAGACRRAAQVGDLMPPRPPVAAGTRASAPTSATRGSHDGLAGRRRRCKQAEFRSSIVRACRLSQHKQGLPMGPESVQDIGGSGHSLRCSLRARCPLRQMRPSQRIRVQPSRPEVIRYRSAPNRVFGSATGAVGTCYGAITSRRDPLQPAKDLAYMHVLRDP